MEIVPEDLKERVGGALGLISRKVDGDIKRFKEFIEDRDSETGHEQRIPSPFALPKEETPRPGPGKALVFSGGDVVMIGSC
jgi:hypothetical protein